jgi:hypothetical protein
LNLKAFFPNGAMTVVFLHGKCTIIWSNWSAFPEKEKEALWKLIKAHYVFHSDNEELGKRAIILTIGRALQRFRNALNRFYV